MKTREDWRTRASGTVPAVFAYEDVDTGRIRTTAFCSWQTVKDKVCRKIQAHYDSKTDDRQGIKHLNSERRR